MIDLLSNVIKLVSTGMLALSSPNRLGPKFHFAHGEQAGWIDFVKAFISIPTAFGFGFRAAGLSFPSWRANDVAPQNPA